GLVQWLQNVPCYIGRRPRFGHHTGCETSKKPIYRSAVSKDYGEFEVEDGTS
ncbi:unnamed protein product, partial [Rangifer tarandus platyrhynchus]